MVLEKRKKKANHYSDFTTVTVTHTISPAACSYAED